MGRKELVTPSVDNSLRHVAEKGKRERTEAIGGCLFFFFFFD